MRVEGVDQVASDAIERTPTRSRSRRLPSATTWNAYLLILALLTFLAAHATAALVEFQDCLNASRTPDNILHFVPHYVNVTFDTEQPSHLVNITVYGNVTGQDYSGPLPAADDPRWNDPNYLSGKILNTGQAGPGQAPGQSAFTQQLNVLSYTPATFLPEAFCNTTRGGTECPIAPVFNVNTSIPSQFRSFGIQRDLNSTFRFATIDTTLRVTDANNIPGLSPYIACVNVKITPALQSEVFGLLRYLPLAVLVFVAVATVSAAILSPWGTSNPFKWTSNYGRDEDLLRLVTPGFGDCLQYIQFIFLSGSLSLNYPGFFRPVVSAVNWAALMFNQSFVAHGDGVPNPVDGVYVTHADYYGVDSWNRNDQNERHDYGMTRLRQLTGLAADEDIWAGTVIWLLVIIAAVIVVCQLFFFARWIVHTVTNEPEEDLRNKNWPFTGGMLVRLVCNYFLLPLAAVSFFQLVIAMDSAAVVTVFAVILLVLILAFAGWILRIIFAAKPRSVLFDDLQKVLLYGPLYNTYSDDAAPFALVPAMLTFIRAIAFGAIQPSGIAQIVVLAVCEVSYILTLHAFRPFRKQTSMNAYHTFFAVTRLVVILLSVTFVPAVNVEESTRGWIGYVVLFLHALVLVFGFFLNAVQTLIEVIARYAGAGADETTGAATRGTFVKVFGKRQLTRRRRRPARSLTSEAMLTDDADALENKSAAYGSRSRSLSASSAILLNQRTSSHFDRVESGSAGRETSAANSTYNALNDAEAGPSTVIRAEQGQAPFYRAPRQRRPTGDLMPPGQRSRASWLGSDSPTAGPSSPEHDKRESIGTIGKAISTSPEGKTVPSPAYMRKREGSDPTILNDPRRTDVDYAVREVDFYYNVRGPRLNDQPTRQLKTGPADPVGPVSSATGWFRTMFGRKTKDQSKGFEVVRSTRAPPEGMELGASPELEPYQDNPTAVVGAAEPPVLPGQRTRSGLTEEDRDQTIAGAEEQPRELDAEERAPVSPVDSTFDRDESGVFHGRPSGVSAISDLAPSLEPIDSGSSMHMPSRFNSSATAATNRGAHPQVPIITGPAGPLDSQPPLLAPIDSGSSIHMPSRFNSTATSAAPQRQASSAEQYSGTFMSRGNSYRAHSDERDFTTRPVTPPGRMPFQTPLSPIAASGRTSIGAESALSIEPDFNDRDEEAIVRNMSGNLSLPVGETRPSSTGQVQHYRIADRITQGTPDIELQEGHAAEVVDGSRRSGRSSEAADRTL